MKKILLTNFNIVNFSGSEIDTISIANYFYNNGYHVDIFTLEKGNPLLKNVNKNIRIIIPCEKDKLLKRYDIIWSHHFPLLDYVLFALDIRSKHIFYISLSSFEPYEALPEYCNDLSLIGAISDEVKLKLIEEGCNKDKIKLFPNYATNEYFNCKFKINNKVKRICIVSNHVPDELVEFKVIAERNDIKVDIFGIQYTPKYIDSKLLSKYDVIISICKTIYYAIAMGKCAYCYDLYGGYGYINKDNIENAYSYNFSGRGFGKKKSSKEILKDILDNYNVTLLDLNFNKDFANNNFNFEKNVKEITDIILDNNIDENEFYKKYSYLNRRSRLFIERLNVYCNKYYELLRDYLELVDYKVMYENEVLKYNEIVNSTSWKITRPIRFLKIIFHKILRRKK